MEAGARRLVKKIRKRNVEGLSQGGDSGGQGKWLDFQCALEREMAVSAEKFDVE